MMLIEVGLCGGGDNDKNIEPVISFIMLMVIIMQVIRLIIVIIIILISHTNYNNNKYNIDIVTD